MQYTVKKHFKRELFLDVGLQNEFFVIKLYPFMSDMLQYQYLDSPIPMGS